MKLQISDWYSPDIELEDPKPVTSFSYLIQFDVEEVRSYGATSYSVIVATKDQAIEAIRRGDAVMILPIFRWKIVLFLIEEVLRSVEAGQPDHWESFLGKYFDWEYEGVSPPVN